MLRWFRTLFARKQAKADAERGVLRESQVVVSVDEKEIVCKKPSGKIERITWEDLDAVTVTTNDTGPIGTDVWWFLIAKDGAIKCLIPGGAMGEKEMMAALQKLPGFDNLALIDAMACTDNRKFPCWKRLGTSNDLRTILPNSAD